MINYNEDKTIGLMERCDGKLWEWKPSWYDAVTPGYYCDDTECHSYHKESINTYDRFKLEYHILLIKNGRNKYKCLECNKEWINYIAMSLDTYFESGAIQKLFERDDTFFSAIENKNIDIVSSRDMRIPLQIKPGSDDRN